MPFSKRRIEKILRDDQIPADRWPVKAGRVCESFLKQKLQRHEDRAAAALYALYAAAWNDVRAAWQGMADARGLDALAQDQASRSFRRELMAVVQPRLRGLAREAAASGLEHVYQAQVAGYYGRLWLLDSVTRPEVRINAPRLAEDETLRAILLKEDVSRTLIYELLGEEWRRTYELELDDLVTRIERVLNQAMDEGVGMAEAQRRVAQAIGVVIDRRRGARGSLENKTYRANFNRVQAITRTAIMEASNRGAKQAYAANPDVLQGYEWLTARDERVCRFCRPMDRVIFTLDGKAVVGGTLAPAAGYPPLHYNCRCTIIPIVIPGILVSPDANPAYDFGEWLEAAGIATVSYEFAEAA